MTSVANMCVERPRASEERRGTRGQKRKSREEVTSIRQGGGKRRGEMEG